MVQCQNRSGKITWWSTVHFLCNGTVWEHNPEDICYISCRVVGEMRHDKSSKPTKFLLYAACFVSRNLVNTFPWVVGTLSDSLCMCPASWLDDVEGSSSFPVLLNPGVISHLAPKKWLTEPVWDKVTCPWLFQYFVQISLTFPWLENVFPFFQVFKSVWEPCMMQTSGFPHRLTNFLDLSSIFNALFFNSVKLTSNHRIF